MNEIKDFKCTYDNSAGISEEVTSRLNLKFPDAYLDSDSLVLISKELRIRDGAVFCEMPFDHTLEAESMGGQVNLGDGRIGPRASSYVCSSLEEVLELPEIDYTKGRMYQVLKACEKLSEQEEIVVLQVSGPFTILNTLIDLKYVFRGMRKTPELVSAIFAKLSKELLRYVKEAENYGVRFISYADSAGGVNIVGPKVAAQVAEEFTYEFLKSLELETKKETMILLCPKTTFALLGTEKAEFLEIELDAEMSYQQACLEQNGKIKLAGQMCLKNIGYMLTNKKLKEVKLL